MRFYKKIIWVILCLNIVLLGYVVFSFQVDDMTLSKGEVYDFNEGWHIERQDGSIETLEKLPYRGKSKPGEILTLTNRIPEEYWGMSLSFLSADKTLLVRMDEKEIYEFGQKDVRSFGHTPGSVMNFIDIPADLSEGIIRIEMFSPYADYGAMVNEITIGKRDVLILKLLINNAWNLFACFIIIICGIGFALLFLIQKKSGQETGGIQYLCVYCIIAALYYGIETKVLSIFYGNLTMYSVLVFLCLMTMPLPMILYYADGILKMYRKRWQILAGISCANIFFQFLFQLLHVFDFMEMVFCSHMLILIVIGVIGKSCLDTARIKKDKDIVIEMTALLLTAGGGILDIMRMYVVGAGDMGKFSRLATAMFSLLMLYKHFSQMIMGYSYNMKENARLLQHEMEYVEKKNEQLEKAYALAEEAKQEALAANAAKGKFLAHMSHEIRTPINAVLGMDTMILRETTDMQIKEYALDIQNAGHSLLALINDILDFSKIESGKMEIIPIEYDFSSLIHDISNMIAVKLEGKNLSFRILVDKEIPFKLSGDDVRIRQVLVNLLNNAVKYTKEGSITLRVRGEIQEDRVVLYFAVEDTGIGIKEEDISRLFEEFERIEEKRNRNIEGTGLGLNITARLLLLMGSRLQVESTYGKGSCFFFSLEQLIVDAKPVGDLEERIRQQSGEYSYMAVFTAPDAQILVVDDNTVNLKVFVSLLKNTKVNVDVAEGGRECLEMVCKKHYDLIFLDHMMPEPDGVETLHLMKKLPDNQCVGTPVVALTANAISGAKEMYLSEGFDAFLPKPIHPEKLEQMILRLLPRELLIFDAEEEADKSETEMDSLSQEELPAVDGIDWSYGQMHLPDIHLLLETVRDFYKTIDAEADALEQYYRGIGEHQDMLKQYRVKVHAMKSSANLIGATVLGGMAKLLENAAAEGNLEVIERLTELFIEEWRSYREKLRICVKEEEEKKKAEDSTVILAYLEMLRQATEELDIDEMDKNMQALEQFSYPGKMQKEIEKLSTLVMNMDSAQAEALITNMMKEIREGGTDK